MSTDSYLLPDLSEEPWKMPDTQRTKVQKVSLEKAGERVKAEEGLADDRR
jgi:hypothetical protein